MTPEIVLSTLGGSSRTGRALREEAMTLLDQLDGYDWSGIYRLEGEELVLDAFEGAATDRTRIPVGRGVCGTAVAENADLIVHDVRDLTNYLSCSASTRSEIVVLIRDADGHILGQIDIDGHTVGRFTERDRAFLAEVAAILAARWPH